MVVLCIFNCKLRLFSDLNVFEMLEMVMRS